MAKSADLEQEDGRRRYGGGYNASHPIPTIQKHRENQSHIQAEARKEDNEYSESEGKGSKALHKIENTGKKLLGREDSAKDGELYDSENRNAAIDSQDSNGQKDSGDSPPVPQKDTENKSKPDPSKGSDSTPTSKAAANHSDPKEKRKAVKHTKRDDGERQVTDPVTHLPVVIRDLTSGDLDVAPENERANGPDPAQDVEQQIAGHSAMDKLFPPPDFDSAQAELVRTYGVALGLGIGSIVICATLVLVTSQLLWLRKPQRGDDGASQWQRIFVPVFLTVLLSALVGGFVIWAVGGWLRKRVEEIWEDEIWDGARAAEQDEVQNEDKPPESTQWLNSLLASIWPLVNPDLFTSLSDTLEDVMQASLPKLVRMVSVDDIGQGSEAFRILGVRWLPTGAASKTVNEDGEIQQGSQGRNSQKPDQSEAEPDNDGGQGNENLDSGLQGEEGDFVNMEIAFAYRARASGKSLKTKSKNAHLYLKFYLPAGVALPVWVELRGIVGTMRVRLQLTPDPPFVSLATITFLGQPKADLSCVPLSKHNLNLMDLPLISSFVQSSIDAALAEYVAPKSLTLDLKDMLVGDDFKKDTTAHGVIVVRIKRATDFKEGDGDLGPIKKGSTDGYVTVGWSKFGKPVAATRIIIGEQEPVWEEYAHILVGPEELNAKEMLQLQLWDSDRTSADDDLGRVEVDLQELMESSETKGTMHDREDRFCGDDGEEEMPGTLFWSVGYFAKKGITPGQIERQTEEPDVNTKEDLKQRVDESAERKLREATIKDESKETSQQKAQDYKEREDNLLIHSRPSTDFPSGILSVQIHQISGLQLEKLRRKRKDKTESDSDKEDEDSDDLPSSYCTIILNHTKIFKTRTKPKNAKPFFNASCERFIRDWRTTELMVSVRDMRVHENHPLLGIVYLPLSELFAKRSQVIDNYPLAGGIGYGRVRISCVFRSVELQSPKELLGWDYGTIEILGLQAKDDLPEDIRSLKCKLRSTVASAKMVPDSDEHGSWKPKHKSGACIAVKKRYSTPLMIEFYNSSMLKNSTPALAVLWLQSIPDSDSTTLTLPVWRASKDALQRASSCVDYTGLSSDEQPLGSLSLTLKFHPGLSGYHQSLARRAKDSDLHDVMEVLDTANSIGDRRRTSSNLDANTLDDRDAADNNSSSSSSSSSSDDSDAASATDTNDASAPKRAIAKVKAQATQLKSTGKPDSEDGKRGPVAQVQDYREHRKGLHRRHRGLMQWKGVRTVDWMLGKAERGKERVVGLTKHGEREPGVETEV